MKLIPVEETYDCAFVLSIQGHREDFLKFVSKFFYLYNFRLLYNVPLAPKTLLTHVVEQF